MKLVNMKRDEETANASLLTHALTPAVGPGLSSVPGCEHDETKSKFTICPDTRFIKDEIGIASNPCSAMS